MKGEAVTTGMRRHPQFSPTTGITRKLCWPSIYREGGLACANYPAYPAVTKTAIYQHQEEMPA